MVSGLETRYLALRCLLCQKASAAHSVSHSVSHRYLRHLPVPVPSPSSLVFHYFDLRLNAFPSIRAKVMCQNFFLM